MAYPYFQSNPQNANQMMPQMQVQPQWQSSSAGASASYGYGQPNQNSYAAPPTSQMSVDWIQGGLNSAKAYPKPAPGCGIILMDSDEDKFYIKKTDASGFPMPLRAFTYREEVPQNESQMSRQSAMPDMSQYVTKDDFEKMLEKYLGPVKESK